MRTSFTTGELTAFLTRPAFRALEGVAKQLGVRLPAADANVEAPVERMPPAPAQDSAPLDVSGKEPAAAGPSLEVGTALEAPVEAATPARSSRADRAARRLVRVLPPSVASTSEAAPRSAGQAQGPVPHGHHPVPPTPVSARSARPPLAPEPPGPVKSTVFPPAPSGTSLHERDAVPPGPSLAPEDLYARESAGPTRTPQAFPEQAPLATARPSAPGGLHERAAATTASPAPERASSASASPPPLTFRDRGSMVPASPSLAPGDLHARGSAASASPSLAPSDLHAKASAAPASPSPTPGDLHAQASVAPGDLLTRASVSPALSPVDLHARAPASLSPGDPRGRSPIASTGVTLEPEALRENAASRPPAPGHDGAPALTLRSRHDEAPTVPRRETVPAAPSKEPRDAAVPTAARRVVRLLSPAPSQAGTAPAPPPTSTGRRLTFEAPTNPPPEAPAPQRDAATLRLGEQVTRGMAPVWEQAHQVTQPALPAARATTPTPPDAAVRNTFNVNVHLDPGNPQAGLDRRSLEDALVDILRETARRHGLEV